MEKGEKENKRKEKPKKGQRIEKAFKIRRYC